MVSYFQKNIWELRPPNMFLDVAPRKVTPKYVAVNLSIILNIENVKDMMINK